MHPPQLRGSDAISIETYAFLIFASLRSSLWSIVEPVNDHRDLSSIHDLAPSDNIVQRMRHYESKRAQRDCAVMNTRVDHAIITTSVYAFHPSHLQASRPNHYLIASSQK